jgi:hypothetical protein
MNTRIDDRILDTAEEFLLAQKFVPYSPAALDCSGDICFCAAGILAHAGLSCRFSTEDAIRFGQECISAGTVEPLFLAFRRLGWSSVLCAEMVKQNNEASVMDRTSVVMLQLERLRTAQSDAEASI